MACHSAKRLLLLTTRLGIIPFRSAAHPLFSLTSHFHTTTGLSRTKMPVEFHQPQAGETRPPPLVGPLGTIPNPIVSSKSQKKKEKQKAAPKAKANNNKNPQLNLSAKSLSSEMKTTIQILSHGTSDCQSPSLILKTAKGDRHLFGRFGEGLQRTINQNRVKFAKLQNVFISGPLEWSSMGGLPGIVLTLADQGVKKLTLHSAVDNLPWACATWRNFVLRGNLDFQIRNASKQIYSDKYICVKGAQIYPDNFTRKEYRDRMIDQDEVDCESLEIFNKLFAHTQKQIEKPDTAEKNSDGSNKQQNENGYRLRPIANIALPKVLRDPRVSCYMIQIRPSRGKFIPQKAVELGVPRGALFAKLTNGESVVTPDGNTVNPQDVMEPPNINGRVLIVDCPSKAYVQDLIHGHDWRESLIPGGDSDSDPTTPPDTKRRKPSPENSPGVLTEEGYGEPVVVAYHMLGESVNPFQGEYFDWITDPESKVFAPECMHFITHPQYAPDGISLEAAALLNMKLRKIFPDNFKRLYTADAPQKFPNSETTGNKLFPMLTMGNVSVEPDIRYQTAFEKFGGKVDWPALEAALDSDMEANGQEQIIASEQDLRVQESAKSAAKVESHLKDIEVVTFGTGSAMPNKYRNVVSTLVNVPGRDGNPRRSILFDCGENTLGNMQRIYGPEGLKDVVSHIGIFYLSHLHADHHLGAISFINFWLKISDAERPLYVMGPWKYFDFLSEWSQLEPAIKMGRLRFVDNETAIVGWGFCDKDSPNAERRSYLEEMKKDMGLTAVRTCKAIHCELAYCVSFTFDLNAKKTASPGRSRSRSRGSTFQVSYSGDTRPTDFFAKRVGQGSDLLIHEATHENDLEAEAFKKRHSTISQAIGIARKMEAKYTVLTHFSQRYPKLPSMDGLIDESDGQKPAEEKAEKLPVFALAFDGMHIKIGDIPKQRYFFGELGKVFDEVKQMEDQEVEEEEK